MLWDMKGKALQLFKGHLFQINSVAFSPDGKTVLTGSRDGTARLWDLKGNLITLFSGHEQEIYSVGFSPDGKTILTGSLDNTARLWDLQGNTLQIFRGHDGAVVRVAFSPDGKTILTGSFDKTARIWDIKMPFEMFIKSAPIKKLTTQQLIHYGMLNYDDVIISDNADVLNNAIDYYLTLAETQPDLKKRNVALSNVLSLLKRVKRYNGSYEDNISFVFNSTRAYYFENDKSLLKDINETIERSCQN